MTVALAQAVSAHGLILRGGFNFARDEVAPEGPGGGPAKAVLLVGNAGAAYWPLFRAWLRTQPAGIPNPLDSWSRAVIGAVAAEVGARAVSPSDKPYLPFQKWAMRAERLRPSPVGILMHPAYGLWHAYRGALLLAVELPVPPIAEQIHLCDACAGKPCLNSCPVGAYSEAGFDAHGCRVHVRLPAGEACREAGCFDRNACPHGAAFRYPAEVQAFHMASFAPVNPARLEDRAVPA